jgi:succinoglycan biosynthesis protein ExoA
MTDLSPRVFRVSQSSDSAPWPFVTVVMPVRNERTHIQRSIEAILAQDYCPDRMEILIADGGSTDGTREILDDLASNHPGITVFDNDGRIVSTGLNMAIAHAHGEIVIRVDAHAEIAGDFVRQSVLLLQGHPEAWEVGGPIVHRGRTTFARAAAVAMSHPMAVGRASHRFPGYQGYAEGAAFPAIRRWVFDRVGFFDERLVRNQDDEFNYRIVHAGGKVYLSQSVRYVYYVRESPRNLFRQYLQYGFWRVPVIRKHGRPTAARQLAPPAFVVLIPTLAVVGLFAHSLRVGLALPAAYAVVLLALAVAALPKAGVAVGLLVPVAVATMHIAYGLGFAYGWLRSILFPSTGNPPRSMARLNR